MALQNKKKNIWELLKNYWAHLAYSIGFDEVESVLQIGRYDRERVFSLSANEGRFGINYRIHACLANDKSMVWCKRKIY